MILKLKCHFTSDDHYLFVFGVEKHPNYTIFVIKSNDEIRELRKDLKKPLVDDYTTVVALSFDDQKGPNEKFETIKMSFLEYKKAKKSEIHHPNATLIFEKVIDIANEQSCLPMLYAEGNSTNAQNIHIIFMNFDGDWAIHSECINPFSDENFDLHVQDIQLCQFSDRRPSEF